MHANRWRDDSRKSICEGKRLQTRLMVLTSRNHADHAGLLCSVHGIVKIGGKLTTIKVRVRVDERGAHAGAGSLSTRGKSTCGIAV